MLKEFKGYKKGINFGGWLSQCEHSKAHYDSFIRADDFAKVKSLGYDHIRLPIDYELIEDEEGNFIEENFSYLDFAVEKCRENGLNLVLDLHRTPGFSFDPNHNKTGLFESRELQERFYAIWDKLAAKYAMNSGMLAFELLNEVTEKSYMPVWIQMAENAVRIIRSYSGEIRIILGGYWNNSVCAVKDLPLPFDENIVYNFHFYEPLLFTHQGAYWIDTMDRSFRCRFGMTYGEYEEGSRIRLRGRDFGEFQKYPPDEIMGEKYFDGLIREAVKTAEERNVCLYCGEFGVIELADKAEAEKWFDVFYSVMDRYSIGNAIWTYRQMDFSVVD